MCVHIVPQDTIGLIINEGAGKTFVLCHIAVLLPSKAQLCQCHVFVKYSFSTALNLGTISNLITINVNCVTYFECHGYALNLNFKKQYHWNYVEYN